MMFSNEFRCFVAKVLVDFMKAEYNQSAGSLFAEAYDSNIVFGIGSSMNLRKPGSDDERPKEYRRSHLYKVQGDDGDNQPGSDRVSDEPVGCFSDPDDHASAELDDTSLGSDKSILEKPFKQHKIKPFKQISGIKPFKQITGIKPSKQITGKPVKQQKITGKPFKQQKFKIPVITCKKPMFQKSVNPNYQDTEDSEHDYMKKVFDIVRMHIQINEQGSFTQTDSWSQTDSKPDATIHREDSDSDLEDRYNTSWMRKIYIKLKQYVGPVNEQGSFTSTVDNMSTPTKDYTYDNFSSLAGSKFEHQNFDEMTVLANMDIPVNKIVPDADSWKEVYDIVRRQIQIIEQGSFTKSDSF